MKIVYDQGPDRINCGVAGQFERGKPREVPDELAARLLKKKTIRFTEQREPTKKEI